MPDLEQLLSAAQNADALLGLSELADAFGVKVGTVRNWKWEGRLPEPDYVISGTPIWRWGPLVEKFARPGTAPGVEKESRGQ